MPVIFLSILIQIACAVHCVRNNRNGLWLMVIIFLSLPGCLAYAIFEIFPAYAGRREVRALKSAAARKLDPDRELRRAREAVDIADTAANHSALGDTFAEAGEWKQAAAHYREALARAPGGGDRAARMKLARAELEAGDDRTARALLEALPPSASDSENDRAALLLARALEGCGETGRALAFYEELASRMAGCEAQCRLAALLIASGRRADALDPLTEVERRVKRLDRFERNKHAAMYDWAARTLTELRAG
ncbi:MAG TPA: tetratricopeptide repeat protein [Allosphingosinicella sp.]|nr:tetratricopeptide repeat protein [Allosphingosinicella sp.]